MEKSVKNSPENLESPESQAWAFGIPTLQTIETLQTLWTHGEFIIVGSQGCVKIGIPGFCRVAPSLTDSPHRMNGSGYGRGIDSQRP